MSDEAVRGWIGTFDPARAVWIEQAYPLAFVDLARAKRRARVLDGPSAAFRQVTFHSLGYPVGSNDALIPSSTSSRHSTPKPEPSR